MLAGPDADFAREHDDLVRGTARKMAREFLVIDRQDDLASYGFVGLLDARERFEPDRGIPFTRYAYYRIRGAIVDGLRDMSGLPRKTRNRLLAAAADAALEQAGEQWAERGQYEEQDGMGAAFYELFGKVTSGMILAQLAEEQVTPETRLIQARERAAVMAALARLPQREQTLIYALYFEEKTLDEMRAELGVETRSGASRIHGRALGMLKTQLTTAAA